MAESTPLPSAEEAIAELRAAAEAEREALAQLAAAQQRKFAAQDVCAKLAQQGLNIGG